MTNNSPGHPNPTDEELNFDDVKNLRREAPDVDQVMQRAREKFNADLDQAPVFAPFGRKRTVAWVGGVAAAAALATVFALTNPWGDNGPEDQVVLNQPTQTSTATASPTPTAQSTEQNPNQKPTKTTPGGSGTSTETKTTGANLNWKNLGNRTGFTTHNGAVQCSVEPSGAVFCGVQNPTFKLTKKPAWCQDDWVDYISASASQKPSFTCLSDAYSPFMDSHEALPKVAKVTLPGGTQCTVNGSSVSCSFKGRNTFTVTPASYRGVTTPKTDPDGAAGGAGEGDADPGGADETPEETTPADSPKAKTPQPENPQQNPDQNPTPKPDAKPDNQKTTAPQDPDAELDAPTEGAPEVGQPEPGLPDPPG